MREYEDIQQKRVEDETAAIEAAKDLKHQKVQAMHDQSRIHAIETQRKRIKEIKDRQAEEREYVKRIKEEILDVENKEVKKKADFHSKMEEMQNHAKEIKAQRVVAKKKEAEQDIEYTR